jgi:hypothetical protein
LVMEISYEEDDVHYLDLELGGVHYHVFIETESGEGTLYFLNNDTRVEPPPGVRVQRDSLDDIRVNSENGCKLESYCWYDVYVNDALLLHLDRVTAHRVELGKGVKET